MNTQTTRYAPFSKIALVVLLCAFTGCERPFVPPIQPTINIISPGEGTTLRLNPEADIVVEASSFREIQRVEANGQPLTFVESTGQWETTISLTTGINKIDITAFDIEDAPGTRTIFLAHVNPTFDDTAPTFPSPWRLGGHTATLLNNGNLLVTGGAPGAFQNAVQQSFMLQPDADELTALPQGLITPRYGHSATLLPDGRVLILGGSTTSALSIVSQLIETAEIYDPATGAFSDITISGDPLLRSEHVAFVSQGPSSLIIDVYGGLGRSPNPNSDNLETRGDIRSFRFSNNTLSPLSDFADTQIEPAFGMAATFLSDPENAENGRYLVSGSNFLQSGAENINFSIDFDAAPIRVTTLDQFRTPRIQHAAVTLEPGLVAVFGGFQGAPRNATSSTEIFVEVGARFYSIDSRALAKRRRFSHTATKLPSGRILILGGFAENGQAITESEYFDW